FIPSAPFPLFYHIFYHLGGLNQRFPRSCLKHDTSIQQEKSYDPIYFFSSIRYDIEDRHTLPQAHGAEASSPAGANFFTEF
ncbi:hypothetical protein AALA54_15175, partial [Oscillospiraceae bacterium 44-34]